MIIRRTVLSTLGIIAVSGMLLTGCSIGGQSKVAACKVLESDVAGAASTLSAAFQKVSSDPAAAEKALKSFDDKLTASVAKVSNVTVKKAGDAAVAAINALDADLKEFEASPTDSKVAAKLQADSVKVQSTFSKLGSTCTG